MEGIRGDRVLIERRALDIDQDELARRAGVSRPYISKIERNKADNVGIKVVYALADALGVSAAYLLGFTDDPLSNVEDDRENRSVSGVTLAGAEHLFEVWRNLGRADRETVLHIAESLLRSNGLA